MPGTSVELITGRIGDGKTYHTLKYRLIPALERGRHIFTNIDFGPNEITKDGAIISTGLERFARNVSLYLGKDCRGLIHQFKDESEIKNLLQLKDLSGQLLQIPKGSTIILDEAQMLFPAPVPGHLVPINPLFIKWVAYVRHFDQELILITQSPSLIHKSLLGLINENVKIKNLAFISSVLGKQYRVSYHQSVWSEAHGSENHTFDKDIFKLYQSAFAYGVKNNRPLPSFLVIPVIGVFIWFGFMFVKGKDSFVVRGILGSKPPITSPGPVSTPPLSAAQPVVENKPIRASEAILLALQEFENSKVEQYRDSPVSTDLDDSPPRHLVLHNATERGKALLADPDYIRKHNIR